MIVHAQDASRREFLAGAASRLSEPLPPSERDFEVFARVVVEGATTRAAAAELGLSQTRIVQIRDRVAEWIATEVPAIERLSAGQRLRLAASIASQRIDYLYSLALEAWRESKGPQTTVRSGESGKSPITRQSHGDPRYLAAAARLSQRQLEVVERGERAIARSQESGARGQGTGVRGQEPVASGQEGATPIYEEGESDPPVGDCSKSAAPGPEASPAFMEDDYASPCDDTLSDEIEARRRAFLAALADAAAPVQPPPVNPKTPPEIKSPAPAAWRAAGVSRPMAPLAGEPESMAMDSHREADASRSPADTLRQERRARQKLLDRKLRARAK